jgi:hypothetical protein
MAQVLNNLSHRIETREDLEVRGDPGEWKYDRRAVEED